MNFRQSNEDLFESSRMSFGEHLEELRKVLIRALYGVAIGCIFGFWAADRVVKILEKPLVDAVNDYRSSDAEDELVERYNFIPPEYRAWIEQEKMLPKQIHIDPGQLITVLQTVIPEFGKQVNLDPYSFRAEHFTSSKLTLLCQLLSTQKGTDASKTKKIKSVWMMIPGADQEIITRIGSSKQSSSDDLAAVVDIFNRLSRLDDLSKADAFKDDVTEATKGFWDFFGTDTPRPLAKIKSQLDVEFDPVLNRRLNRTLLTTLFTEEMPALKLDLVPIEIWENAEFQPQALGVGEPFSVWLKAGLFTGLVLAGPWVFFQLWSFVASGLYPHEQKYIHIFLPISIFLFVSGVLLAFFFVFQPVLGFLFSFNRSMGIAPEMRINDWLSFVMFLPLGFGLAFQLPLVMLFMNRIDLFSIEDYLSKWRIAVLVIFVLSMFLTPADPISMLLLALPLTLLYFLGVAMCRWMPRNQNPFGEDAARV
jgi:sec-independent protein translocase protein TatC